MSDTTPEAIAQWMLSRLEQSGRLYQAEAVQDIAAKFGDEYTYLNDNGNPAIDRRILRAFRQITGDTALEEQRSEKYRHALIAVVSIDVRAGQLGGTDT